MASKTNPFTNRIIGYGTKPADQFQPNDLNYRTHPQKQRDAVQASLRELGWIGVVVENRTTGNLIDGHERVWQALKNNEEVPYIEVDLSIEEERLALAIFDPLGAMAETDSEIFDALLREVNSGEVALQELLASMAEDAGLLENDAGSDLLGVAKDAKPNPRNLPIDVIYTLQGADATCCLAVRAGLKYGIQSKSYTLCPYCTRGDEAHKVVFIDNNYFEYDHDAHLKAVQELRPRYATVRDAMTPEQCGEAGIEHYELGRILEWAEELAQYAENVIVIPKYDCIADVPNKFM